MEFSTKFIKAALIRAIKTAAQQAALDAFAAATNWSEYTDYFEIAS